MLLRKRIGIEEQVRLIEGLANKYDFLEIINPYEKYVGENEGVLYFDERLIKDLIGYDLYKNLMVLKQVDIMLRERNMLTEELIRDGLEARDNIRLLIKYNQFMLDVLGTKQINEFYGNIRDSLIKSMSINRKIINYSSRYRVITVAKENYKRNRAYLKLIMAKGVEK